MTDQELRDQCKREAEAQYPPHLAPDEIIGDHFMLVRVAVANTLFDERTKALRLVEAGNAMCKFLSDNCAQYPREAAMIKAWDEAFDPYTQTKHPTE